MMKKNGLSISLAVMAVFVAIVGVILVTLLSGTTGLVSDMLLQQSQTANNAFAQTLQDYQDEALERAEMIAASEDIINAVENRDKAALVKALNNLSAGLDLVTLCDSGGTVLARTHSDKTGDSVGSQKAISAALTTGTGISTIEPGTVIGLSTRGSAAIEDHNGRIIGALTCGHDLSNTKYVDAVKAQNNCEVTFFAGSERMNTTLTDAQGNRVVGTKADDRVVDTVINNKQAYNSRLELFGKAYQVYYAPVLVGSEAIGMLFTGVQVENAVNQERNMVVLIVVAAVLLLLVVVITAMVIRWITGKIHWYESMLDSIPFPISVTDTNMNWTFINKPVEQMLNVKRDDMRGKPCSTWGAAICNTGDCGVTCLKNDETTTFFEQSGLEFQVNTSFLLDKKQRKSGHIEVVQDISERIKTQKAGAMLVEKIGEVSQSFVSASQNIADGASALAQSSVEQASAVQQLSGSISELAEKTKDNAEMAGKAAKLADTIKTNAKRAPRRWTG